jgi:hypothetical protein
MLLAHNSVDTASTQFNVYCQHTIQYILPAQIQCTLTLSVHNVTVIGRVTSLTDKCTRSVRHALPVLGVQNLTFIFLPSLSLSFSTWVKPWTETACSHLVYRYTANRYKLSPLNAVCYSDQAPVLQGVWEVIQLPNVMLLLAFFLLYLTKLSKLHCLRMGIKLWI